MSKSIKISPNHGLNPTMCTCFFCGKEKNEIALLGRLPGDAEAPRSAIIDYEPCEECDAKMSAGITLIGATETPNWPSQMPMNNGAYPTGSWLVMTEHGIESVFSDKAVAKDVIAAKRACVPQEVLDMLNDAFAKADTDEDGARPC